jgi:hypothetical protein
MTIGCCSPMIVPSRTQERQVQRFCLEGIRAIRSILFGRASTERWTRPVRPYVDAGGPSAAGPQQR